MSAAAERVELVASWLREWIADKTDDFHPETIRRLTYIADRLTLPSEPTSEMREAAERIEEELRYYRKCGLNPDNALIEVSGKDLSRLLAFFHFPNADWEALKSLAMTKGGGNVG